MYIDGACCGGVETYVDFEEFLPFLKTEALLKTKPNKKSRETKNK